MTITTPHGHATATFVLLATVVHLFVLPGLLVAAIGAF